MQFSPSLPPSLPHISHFVWYFEFGTPTALQMLKFPESIATINQTIAELESKLLWHNSRNQSQGRSGAATVVYIYHLRYSTEQAQQLQQKIVGAPDSAAALQAALEGNQMPPRTAGAGPNKIWPVLRLSGVGKEDGIEAEDEEDDDDDNEGDEGEGEGMRLRRRVDSDDDADVEVG